MIVTKCDQQKQKIRPKRNAFTETHPNIPPTFIFTFSSQEKEKKNLFLLYHNKKKNGIRFNVGHNVIICMSLDTCDTHTKSS